MKKALTVIVIGLLSLSMFSMFAPQVKADMTWTKYGGNPLNLGDNVSDPSVVWDGTTYKMWYVSGTDIYYATSYDGISWNTHGVVLQKGAYGSWETRVGSPSVILDGTTYKMWYEGYNPVEQCGRIGYATSYDGISWTKYGGNPVLIPGGNGGWDDYNVFNPSVLKDGSTYKMWYVAQAYQYSPLRIGYATSSDGISWAKYASNPVLVPGSNGVWDDKHVSGQFVMMNATMYEMYYAGQSNSDIVQIGLATSTDGVSWTKHDGNPILPVGSVGAWDSHALTPGSVVFNCGTYRMWYQGMDGSWRIGLAYSSRPPQQVAVDIKPGSDPNSINLGEGGLLPVVVLGSETLSVDAIDPETIRLGGVGINLRGSAKAPKIAFSVEDIDNDGFVDIVAFFSVQELVTLGALTSTSTELELTGCLWDGTKIIGVDSVNPVPPS